MNALIIADVVARPGRLAVLDRIQSLREEYKIDIALMNGENVAGGFSITPALADELFRSGFDVMTSGNHIFEFPPAAPNTPKAMSGFARALEFRILRKIEMFSGFGPKRFGIRFKVRAPSSESGVRQRVFVLRFDTLGFSCSYVARR